VPITYDLWGELPNDDLVHGIDFLEAVLFHPAEMGAGTTDGVRHGVHRFSR
jgi:hypothetical protein